MRSLSLSLLLLPSVLAFTPPAGTASPRQSPWAAAEPCDSVSSNPATGEMFIFNVSVEGGGSTASVQANDSFTVSFDFYLQVCDTPVTWNFCQVVVGYATAPQPVFCVFRDRVGCDGYNGTAVFKMKAPAFQSQYLIAFDLQRTLTEPACPTAWPQGPPVAARYLACINVTSPDRPVPVTGGADNVTTSSATLHGTVDPVGFPTTARFLYGTTSGAYGDSVTAVESPVNGSGAFAVSGPITGLSGNTRYYYRAVAESENGYNIGEEESLFTGPIFTTESLHEFGELEANGMRTDSVAVHNTGGLPLQVTNAVPLSGQFSVSPTSRTIPPGGTGAFAITFAPTAYGRTTSAIVFLHSGTTSPDTLAVAGDVPVSDYLAAWNIVAVPLTVPDRRVEVVFPGATSNAFEYSGGYIADDSVENGKGYWLKYGSAGSHVISGDPVENQVAAVAAGWNMIGGPTLPVPLDSIVASPPGILTGNIFGYAAGYTIASELLPGKGYWLKVTGPGTLTLKGAVPGAASPRPAHGAMLPEGLPIVVTDAAGRNFTVVVAANAAAARLASMPPPPPDGAFDVRFDGDAMAATAGDRAVALRIAGAGYPVTLRWNGGAPGAALFVDGAVHRLDAPGSATLLAPSRVSVGPAVVGADAADLPGRSFGLDGNYPNPFNPGTTIQFRLDSPGEVRLAVFNPLGEEVARLVDGPMGAGTHTAAFDGSGLPGGVYFCRLSAPGGTSTLRMVLLK